MQEYVLGVALSHEHFVLIDKKRPEWQKGKWNFPGGKMEVIPGKFYYDNRPVLEDPHEAMRREFREETGVDIKTWEKFGEIKGKDYIVHLMLTQSSMVDEATTTTDEQVMLFTEEELYSFDYGDTLVSNVLTIFSFAMNEAIRGGAKMILDYT